MSLHPRRRTVTAGWFERATTQWRTAAWLALVWVMLWGDLSWANVIAGVVVGFAVVTFLPLPTVATHGGFRPWPFLVLAGRFVADLVVASFQVSALALDPRRTPRGAVVGIRLRNPSDVYMTATAELCSLVPGSVVVEAHRLTGMLYVHVLDVDQSGGIEKVRADTLALEARVLRAFASNADLRRSGLYLHDDGGPTADRRTAAPAAETTRPSEGER
ncbi:Na+/H+ antiporter subunit E [Cellulosimicrobium arenosum]|uniref:Na+/H+ antiporter subunit E n=1 Tax=Cellulosimicrobium arenosum TaxID=2708133 RepID=A0A927PE71_9MICO|nr:Na+/H+ antiporter subunit E [Cellulosimicrobium arenosum]MBD8079891.1 Na+/H+ antiporter subunit E [Cellulosimicrobium arenosum]